MQQTFEMYEFVETYRGDLDLNNELIRLTSTLCKKLDFEGWKIIMFAPDKQYGFIQCSSGGNPQRPFDKQGNLVFERTGHKSYLDLVLVEKKILIHRRSELDKYISISKEALLELYCPLFSSLRTEDVIGCLHLSKNEEGRDDLGRQLADKNIVTYIKTIQRLFNLVCREYVEGRSFFDLIHVFSEIIKTRQPTMRDHSYNVAFLSNLVGLRLGFSGKDLYRLYIAALLHDIGKLYIADSILNKPGQLSEDERAEMEKHPLHSFNIIKDLIHRFNNLRGIEDIVLHHHERYDGTGYPYGIEGESIPLESRILAVADAVDAMLSKRSYKEPSSIQDAIRELVVNEGKQFDPRLARIMVDVLIEEKGNQETILKGPITVGTIELLSKQKACQLQGTLIKTKVGYRFKIENNECLCSQCTCQVWDLIRATFHIQDKGKIYEYDAAVKHKDKGNLYISSLTPRLSQSYFSFLWELEGIITLKNLTEMAVTTYKIGGGHLGFYLYKDQVGDLTLPDNIISVKVRFEDGNEITVEGKITKRIKIGTKLYCEYKYLNIPESTRDKIFGQIFKKQTQMRQGPFGLRI